MHHSTNLHIVPPVIAHRGANQFAPENTLAAFLKAKQLGLQWVEFDVMFSKDHELVVIHDEELQRTTNGTGAVIHYTYDELKKLDAGSWFDARFAKERISSLQEVIDFLYEHKLSANIEIKALQNHNELAVLKVLDILKNNTGRFISQPLISSFSHNVLRTIRKHSDECLLAFLMDEWMVDWEQICDELCSVSVNVNDALLTEARIQEIKQSGRQLFVYTVNNAQRAQQLLTWGVDAIFSDCPQEILDFISK
jgi:glycerophosphoryl diester phosphodiesterase